MDTPTDTLVVRRTTIHQTAIPTDLLRDATLTFRARGVLAFLLTFENDTLISTADLPKYGLEGRDALRAVLAELRVRGYVHQHREAYHDEKGRQLWMTVTEISDVPGTDFQAPATDSQAPVTASNSGTDTPSDTPVIPTAAEDGFSGCMSLAKAVAGSSRSSHTSYENSSTGVTARRDRKSKWNPKAGEDEDQSKGFDPAKAVFGDEPEPEPAPVDMDARREEITQRRATRAVGPSENLARYFASLGAQRAAEGLPVAPGVVNKAALATQFAAWAREGITTEQIRTIIETYWQPWFDRNTVVPAWQDLLAKRAYVLSEGMRLAKQAEHEANRYNPDYWRGTR